MATRKLSSQEQRLLEVLIRKSSFVFSYDWENDLLVKPMNDEGMGSLYLIPPVTLSENRSLGKQISEYTFADDDNVLVIASLNVDKNGELFELDIWKTDFSSLIKIPDILE